MICCVVGARPNFIKMAPVVRALAARGCRPLLIHTGQHYDAQLSDVFFRDLQMPVPDLNLGVGSGSHAEQTSRVMTALEPVLIERRPELVVVAGDVNSTLACALVAAKLNIPVAHVEAGLRSFDRTMPEEINRVLTDHLSNLLFTTEPSGNTNLEREGIASKSVHFIGNCMIDTLDTHLDAALARSPWDAFGLQPGAYGTITLHRPSNVDDTRELIEIMEALCQVSETLPLIFPVHPRTRPRLESAMPMGHRILASEPLGYLDFLGIMAQSRLVFTDSGGVQEETTALGVTCLTLRENTERPITLTEGTNRLVGRNGAQILRAAFEALDQTPARRPRPRFWDGHAGERAAAIIDDWTTTMP